MVRYRLWMSPDEQLDALLDGLTRAQQRSLLRHPQWRARCDCGEFGFPYGPLIIRTDETVHACDLCQPSREYLDR
jgi:hypothetical protein